jgi:flagellar biosynthesis/type III secretory pathway protein FliH
MAKFIHSSKTARFRDGENKYEIPANYIGTVPEWVSAHPYFKNLVKDKSIKFVGQPEVAKEEDEAAKRAAEEAEKQAKAEKDKAIAEAKAEAEELAKKEATEKGLDKPGTKKLVEQRISDAISAITSKFGG